MGDTPAAAGDRRTGLYSKLRTAQAEVERVGKGGRNEHQHYDYTKADDVIAAASSAITTAGLISWTEGDAYREVEGEDPIPLSGRPYSLEIVEGQTRNNAKNLTVTARGRLVVLDPDTGERQHFPLIGTGTDSPGDKAIYKAITGGVKYAWQAALQIAFGDDPEDASSSGAQAAAEQTASSGPPFGPPSQDLDRVKRSIQYLIGAGEIDESIQDATDRILGAILQDAGGYLPQVSGKALLRVAAEVKGRVENGLEPGGPIEPSPDNGEALPEAGDVDAGEEPDEPAPDADVDEVPDPELQARAEAEEEAQREREEEQAAKAAERDASQG